MWSLPQLKKSHFSPPPPARLASLWKVITSITRKNRGIRAARRSAQLALAAKHSPVGRVIMAGGVDSLAHRICNSPKGHFHVLPLRNQPLDEFAAEQPGGRPHVAASGKSCYAVSFPRNGGQEGACRPARSDAHALAVLRHQMCSGKGTLSAPKNDKRE